MRSCVAQKAIGSPLLARTPHEKTLPMLTGFGRQFWHNQICDLQHARVLPL